MTSARWPSGGGGRRGWAGAEVRPAKVRPTGSAPDQRRALRSGHRLRSPRKPERKRARYATPSRSRGAERRRRPARHRTAWRRLLPSWENARQGRPSHRRPPWWPWSAGSSLAAGPERAASERERPVHPWSTAGRDCQMSRSSPHRVGRLGQWQTPRRRAPGQRAAFRGAHPRSGRPPEQRRAGRS